MAPPLHLQLAQVESSWVKRNIPKERYLADKWRILMEAHSRSELLIPVSTDSRKREVRDSTKKDFCYLPPGPFVLGEDKKMGELGSGIYMSKYPVTVKEFISFLQESRWNYPREQLDRMQEISTQMDCPVCCISWLDAKQYCRWLRRETKEYYSLPNEEEWEYAARGIDGRPFPWGYKEPDPRKACYKTDTPTVGTVPIGTYSENKSPFGCMELVGGIWEWCVDEFNDPNDPHVLRGGSWNDPVEFCNCKAKIFKYPAALRLENAGFRLIYLPGELEIEYKESL